jgi:hypothetical protein
MSKRGAGGEARIVSATAGKLRPRERDNREPTASDAHITGTTG